MNLVEFLRARLDEDERAARAAADAVGPDWFSGPDSFAVWSQPSPEDAQRLADAVRRACDE